MKKINLYIAGLLLMSTLNSCEEQLAEEPFDQLIPDNILNNEVGLESLLNSAYGNMQVHRFGLIQWHYLEEGPSDLFFETGGGQGRNAAFIQDFTFDAEHPWIGGAYDGLWNAIRDVNLFLDNVEGVTFTQTEKDMRIAEARFIRVFNYYLLNKWFGEVPLILSSTPELYPTKTPASEMNQFIEDELRAVADMLPVIQAEENRITKGAALAVLTKFFLNSKQWQKCMDTADEVIGLGVYGLYPNYEGMFAPENEGNSEFIFVMPQTRDASGMGTEWLSLSLPPAYPEDGPNFAAQFRYYDAFVNSFDPDDSRKNLILTSYVSNDGQQVELLGNDNSRSFKFRDPGRIGADQENDFPVVRYADILLSKAEALNELQGPNQESIDLINQIRQRAGQNMELLQPGAFDQVGLRDQILDERAWEFYSEAKRRSDLLRHGKFIEQALDRDKDAKPYHVLYPFPQSEINANENLVQNEGY
ncbi:RagB/SusD family nutrient uptake outer membrane protein [Echinicola soli]|uniref:RagB/SusD family nutrient uptake outer membrane protein n=1 Tax=Echinicola soli TaxID=2591634 RepID=A0A514CMJ8_9BACT|nr:RagB/SusD family nutrient uptake outer membrane protein [Echinicola soli]QDH81053.1 RagB/SusD family nutrient uptake outer membrane protein [Echinicola soli]